MAFKDPKEEAAFKKDYAKHAKIWKLDPNPDDPEHHYDYRKAWKKGHKPDSKGHWPSENKDSKHPNRYVNGEDTITGKRVKPKHMERSK